MKEESILLRFKQGSSDKIYKVSLQPQDDKGWIVNFAYGRHNKPLRYGTKTATPIPYERAKKAYDKLVRDKMAKGYTDDGSGTPFEGSQEAPERTSWLPQLLNPVSREKLLESFRTWNGSVFFQTKHDGERRAIIWDGAEFKPANRRGLVTTIAEPIYKELNIFFENELPPMTLDCEDMGDYLVIFDVIFDVNRPFKKRAQDLMKIQQHIDRKGLQFLKVDPPVEIQSVTQLDDLRKAARQANEEGVVVRYGGSVYQAGRPNSGGEALKHKFYESATCVVQSVHPTKRSIGICLKDDETNEIINVGNCTIPPNYVIPQEGQLVEIKYLYAYRGGSIYQPQYKGARTDLEVTAAVLSQLKFKD